MTAAEIKKIVDSHTVSIGDYEAIWNAIQKYTEGLKLSTSKCDVCGCTPSPIITTQYGTFCQPHAKY